MIQLVRNGERPSWAWVISPYDSVEFQSSFPSKRHYHKLRGVAALLESQVSLKDQMPSLWSVLFGQITCDIPFRTILGREKPVIAARQVSIFVSGYLGCFIEDSLGLGDAPVPRIAVLTHRSF